jgi:hypothetical protein
MKLICCIILGAIWTVTVFAAMVVWAAADPHAVRSKKKARPRPARAGSDDAAAAITDVFCRAHAENRVYQMRRAAPYN